MLAEFLQEHREELITRCRAKVATRSVSRPADGELMFGIPLFVDQLIRALRNEGVADEGPRAVPSSTAGQTTPNPSDIGRGAAQHGNELLRTGFTIDQVVHDYGDLCQAITEMAWRRAR